MSNPTFPIPNQLYFEGFEDYFSPNLINENISPDFIFSMRDNPDILEFLNCCINYETIIPYDFKVAYYKQNGRPRDFSLESMFKAYVLEKYLGFSDDSLFFTTLKNSIDYLEFCGFEKIPDISQFCRFKKNFKEQLNQTLGNIVEITRPMAQALDPVNAGSLIADTTGIEGYVKENNPKSLMNALKQATTKLNYWLEKDRQTNANKANQKIIEHLKEGKSLKNLKFSKEDFKKPNYNFKKLLLSCMAKEAANAPDCKLQYINGTFCYAYKFGLFSDGLGLPLYLCSLSQSSESDNQNMQETKTIGDSTALKPMLEDFFKTHPEFTNEQGFEKFLGDAAYDSYDNYLMLHEDFGFSQAVIPINPRSTKDLPQVNLSPEGIPLCPGDNKTPFKYWGVCHEKGRSNRMKWICPKRCMRNGKIIIECDNPCSKAKWGRTAYTTFDHGFRARPGLDRNSSEFEEIYKKRAAIERTFNTLKNTLGSAGRKTHNPDTIESDLIMSAIVTHLCFIAAVKMNTLDYSFQF